MRPRVAVVLSGYGVVRRGAEIVLEELLPRLEPDFELDVFSRSGAGPGGVRRPAIPRRLLEPLYLSSRWIRKGLDTLFLDPLHVEWTSHLLLSLPRLLRGRYDVVWHETGLWGGFLLAGARRLSGCRLLDVAHGNHPGWEVPFARRRPDAYVAFTAAFAAAIRERVPGLRVEVIPQAVDVERYRPGIAPRPLAVARPVVLVAGALSREKRPDLAVEAVAAAGASAVLAGDGPLAQSIDALGAERLGAGRYQRLTLPGAEMPALYAAADVVLLTSPLESAPRVLLEAMACGKPVVTTADAGRREMAGDAAVLVEERTAAGYAAGITRALAGEWGERARARALDFSLERAAERFRALLLDLAGGGGR